MPEENRLYLCQQPAVANTSSSMSEISGVPPSSIVKLLPAFILGEFVMQSQPL